MNHLDVIIKKLESRQNIFLTGGAGVGKTTTTLEVIKHFESESKKVAKLASTGMAATLINGQTLHSFFDFGIASNIQELEKNGKSEINKKLKKLLSSIALIVIDEISMVSDSLFDMITHRLNQVNYDGACLVVGDFLQLPPIVQSSAEVRFAFESIYWQSFAFEVFELQEIFRTDDANFIELLHKVRFGAIDELTHNHLNEFIKPLPQQLDHYTFLYGKNISADRHNKEQLKHIDEDAFVCSAQIIKHKKSVSEREIEQFMKDVRIDKELELKIGAPVLFTRNAWNYFNGERGKVVNKDATYIYVEKTDKRIVKVEAIGQSKTRWDEKLVEKKKEMVEESLFTIYQYPLKLAFAITIHKSQGMSIEDLIIDTNEIFAPSQFYVALSRSSRPARLNLIAPKRQWHQLAFVNQKALSFVAGT